MRYPSREEILELSRTDRLQLVEDLWETLEDDLTFLPLSPEQTCELDKRLTAWEADPDAGSTWADVRQRIQERRARS